MTLRSMALAVLLAAGLAGGSAQAQTKDFKIGVVASLTGAFAGPGGGFGRGHQGVDQGARAARPQHRVRDARRRDHAGRRLQRVPPPRRQSGHRDDLRDRAVELGDGDQVARLGIQGADHLRRRRRRDRHSGRSVAVQGHAGREGLHDRAGAVRQGQQLQAHRDAQRHRRVRPGRDRRHARARAEARPRDRRGRDLFGRGHQLTTRSSRASARPIRSCSIAVRSAGPRSWCSSSSSSSG